MVPVIPWYITLSALLVSIALVIAVWTLVSNAATRSGLTPASRRKVRTATAVFLVAWLSAVLVVAPSPTSLLGQSPFYINPLIPLFAIGPAVIVIAAFALSADFRRVLASASLPALHGIQVYRAEGIVFLILLAQGQLPGHFAEPAGWGDLFVGLTAVPVALALARGVKGSRALAVTWNGLGLLDLVTAVGTATGLLIHAPAAQAMGTYPMILIPALLVPISVMLHVISLGRILGARRDAPIRRHGGWQRVEAV